MRPRLALKSPSMAQMREIKGRLKAVGNIKRITKTMQMIATSKFQAAQRRATASQPYTNKIAELVGELASAAGDDTVSHPLLQGPAEPTGRQLLLVITSTRGLCGGYNANILRTAHQFLRDRQGQQIDLEVVGRKGQIYFRFNKLPVASAHTQFSEQPTFEQVNHLAEQYIARFSAGEFDAIRVCSTHFISNARQAPKFVQLLPLPKPEGAEGGPSREYDFSPEPDQLLAELLPMTVKTRLFQCFNEAVVSEQIARMVAMKAATDNADKMGKTLRRQFNRARQAQITNELIEVVSGAEAL